MTLTLFESTWATWVESIQYRGVKGDLDNTSSQGETSTAVCFKYSEIYRNQFPNVTNDKYRFNTEGTAIMEDDMSSKYMFILISLFIF